MYPMQCAAGFPMPLFAGKFEIVGFTATVETPAATARLAIYDDREIKPGDTFGKLIAEDDRYNKKTLLVEIETIAAYGINIFYDFGEPIKIRNGVSICADNIVGGSLCVYRR